VWEQDQCLARKTGCLKRAAGRQKPSLARNKGRPSRKEGGYKIKAKLREGKLCRLAGGKRRLGQYVSHCERQGELRGLWGGAKTKVWLEVDHLKKRKAALRRTQKELGMPSGTHHQRGENQ